jgi:type I restriction enzyme S subunit
MLSPGNKVIQKFSSLVNPLFETIKLHQDEICNLSLERDTLLPKLMSGELKINDLNN